jgi:hypothetical protein
MTPQFICAACISKQSIKKETNIERMNHHLLFCASFLLLFTAPSFVFGWNCNGHAITAQIAFELLSPDALAYYTRIGQYQMAHYEKLTTLAEISCWPDDIKDFTSQYNAWHYMDQCWDPTGNNSVCPTPEEMPFPDIRDALAKCVSQLNSTGLTMQERSFWFSFLVHLVGDIHQPLHTTCLFDSQWPHGDNGGNLFLIQYNGKRSNIHSFHDSCAGLLESPYPRPFAKFPEALSSLRNQSIDLINNQTFPAGVDPRNLSVAQWLREGYSTVANNSYGYGNGTMIPYNLSVTSSSEYTVQLRAVLQSKLALGGKRLALLLTQIFEAVGS